MMISWARFAGCLKVSSRGDWRYLSQCPIFINYRLQLLDDSSNWFKCGVVGDHQGLAIRGKGGEEVAVGYLSTSFKEIVYFSIGVNLERR